MAEKTGIKTIPYYMIMSKCSGKVLDAVDQNVRTFFAFNTPLQQWSFEDRGEGRVTVINRGTHQVLDVNMAGVENGTLVHTWSDVNADNQLWALEEAGTDTYRIRSVPSGRYLDLADGVLNAQAQLCIWDKSTSDTQLWIIKQVYDEPKPLTAVPAPEIKKPLRGRRANSAVSPSDSESAATFGAVLPAETEEQKPRRGRKPGSGKKTAPKTAGRRRTDKSKPAQAAPQQPEEALPPTEAQIPEKTE